MLTADERAARVRHELEDKIDDATVLTMYKGVRLTDLDSIHLMVIIQNEHRRFASEHMP